MVDRDTIIILVLAGLMYFGLAICLYFKLHEAGYYFYYIVGLYTGIVSGRLLRELFNWWKEKRKEEKQKMSPDSEKLDPYVQKVILGLWKREQNKGKGKGKDKTKDDADEDLANVEVYDYSPNKFLINLGVIFVLAQIYVISTSPDEIQPMQIRASIVFAVLWFLKG